MQEISILYSAIYEFPVMALVSIGFYISFRFLKFPDLTIDAAYMFGMTAVGMIVVNFSTNNFVSFLLAMLLGATVGAITGILYSKKTGKILAGMLVAFASYSICYRFLGHQASLSLFNVNNFDNLSLFGLNEYSLLINIGLVLIIYLIIVYIIKTPFGYAMKASGSNPELVKILGISPNVVIIFGLAFSNSIVAIAGWLNAITNTSIQLSNFAMIIHALASVLLGEFILLILSFFIPKLTAKINSLFIVLIIPILGALFYTLLKSIVLYILSGELEIAITTDFQLVLSVVIILLIVATSKIKNITGEKTEDVF